MPFSIRILSAVQVVLTFFAPPTNGQEKRINALINESANVDLLLYTMLVQKYE
jgi:hypothetical protein